MATEAEEAGARQSLYSQALLAWRGELGEVLEEQRRYKGLSLCDGLPRKLEEVFGPGHMIEVEAGGKPDDPVRGATVDGLPFLGVRRREGNIDIYLIVPCVRCGYQMVSERLRQVRDLGRELLSLGMEGVIGGHECDGGAADGLRK